MPIQDLNTIENLNLQLLASYLFLISNVLSIDATYKLKESLLTNQNNQKIKKTAKIAVSLQLIGTIIFLILSLDEYENDSTIENKAFLNANVLSTIATIIRFKTIINDPTSFTGSEDID